MKKMFLILFMILVLSGMAFADQPSGGGSVGDITNTQSQGIGSGNTLNGQGGTISVLSPSATGGAGGAGGQGGTGGTAIQQQQIKDSGNSTNLIGNGIGNLSPSAKATIEKGAIDIDNTNKNININKPVNIVDPKITVAPTISPTFTQGQDQSQGQKQKQNQAQDQKQSQGQVNDQTIAPIQEVTFKSPTQLMNAPSQYVPELNFGSGRMKDITATMPNFAIYGIAKYKGEAILDVIDVNANVKFKNYFGAVISGGRDIAGPKGEYFGKSNQVRIIVICAEAQKTWTTGGNLGGAGSVVSATGLGGASGAGSIVPNWGGTKADDLFTIIFVKVAIEAKVSMSDEYKKAGWSKVE